MQALGLDVKVLSEDDEEIQIKEASEYDDDLPNIEGIMDLESELENDRKLFEEGFSEENAEDEETDQDPFSDEDDEDVDMDFDNDDFKRE